MAVASRNPWDDEKGLRGTSMRYDTYVAQNENEHPAQFTVFLSSSVGPDP